MCPLNWTGHVRSGNVVNWKFSLQICCRGCVLVSERDSGWVIVHTAPAATDVRVCRTTLHRSTWLHRRRRQLWVSRRHTTRPAATPATSPARLTWLPRPPAPTWHRGDSLENGFTRRSSLFSRWVLYSMLLIWTFLTAWQLCCMCFIQQRSVTWWSAIVCAFIYMQMTPRSTPVWLSVI